MSVIFNEMKKIFSFKIVFILLIISALIYELFISFGFEVFPNGADDTCEINTMKELIKDNGNTMNEKSYQELKSKYDIFEGQADNYFKNNKEYNSIGIHSYKEYCSYDIKSEDDMRRLDKIDSNMDGKMHDILVHLQVFDQMIKSYDNRNKYDFSAANETKIKNRMQEIIKNKENDSIFSGRVLENYNRIISGFSLSIVIGIAFMMLPVFLRDRKNKVDYLQYSSRTGRKLFRGKIAAGVLSAVLLATIELVICFVLYRGNNISMFFDSNINSAFISYSPCTNLWISITFGGYIALTILCVYILSIITALITMYISHKVNSYVAGIGIELLLLVVLCTFISEIFFDTIDSFRYISGILMNSLFTMSRPKYIAVIIYSVLFIAAAIITILAVRKEKTRDIMN